MKLGVSVSSLSFLYVFVCGNELDVVDYAVMRIKLGGNGAQWPPMQPKTASQGCHWIKFAGFIASLIHCHEQPLRLAASHWNRRASKELCSSSCAYHKTAFPNSSNRSSFAAEEFDTCNRQLPRPAHCKTVEAMSSATSEAPTPPESWRPEG
jgi:hypothetical protein